MLSQKTERGFPLSPDLVQKAWDFRVVFLLFYYSKMKLLCEGSGRVFNRTPLSPITGFGLGARGDLFGMVIVSRNYDFIKDGASDEQFYPFSLHEILFLNRV
ncbi:MAG: hypothetical protein CM15mV41_0470 [Caudoviricetes sp.]|nr:MAG: hypothetical protein CM15mV41_0470 [Caudoviricetes sp.]